MANVPIELHYAMYLIGRFTDHTKNCPRGSFSCTDQHSLDHDGYCISDIDFNIDFEVQQMLYFVTFDSFANECII